jgi:hypothetical protein
MREEGMKPIIFSTEMVRAILDGRKTQTRRVIKPQPTDCGLVWRTACGGDFAAWEDDGLTLDEGRQRKCPYGQPGDLLWVRETWADLRGMGFDVSVAYRADSLRDGREDADSMRAHLDYSVKWRPSIHMPKRVTRLWLEITDVRVERVQDISEEDAEKEGAEEMFVNPLNLGDKRKSFIFGFTCLWDSINAKRGYSWDNNPWVWVIEFRRKVCITIGTQ